MYTTQSILEPIFRYKKCDIIPEYIRYASTHNKYHIFMINVLYSSLDVCFCFMFPQTKYKYDLLLLRKNNFILSTYLYYIIIICFPYHLNVHCISYIPRDGVFIWRINYCHCHLKYGNMFSLLYKSWTWPSNIPSCSLT